jgi:hypothetical protein
MSPQVKDQEPILPLVNLNHSEKTKNPVEPHHLAELLAGLAGLGVHKPGDIPSTSAKV